MSPVWPPAGRARLEHGIACALLLVALALLILSSLHKRLSDDESFNLDYGVEFLEKGSRATVSPHLPSLSLNALMCFPSGCDREHLDSDGRRRLLVRFPTMVCALLLGVLVYLWTTEVLGPGPALLALLLYVFNPNFLAHGKEVTGDVPTSFFSFLAAFAGFRATLRGRWQDLSWTAVGLAGAALTKYTSLALIPLLGAAALCLPSAFPRRQVFKGCLVVLGLFLILLNLPYAFHGFGARLSDFPLQSQTFRASVPGALRLPVPSAYLLGLDFLLVFQEQPTLQRGMNYALGHLSNGPIWYAFPLMLLLKTPLGFFGLLGVGAWRRAIPRRAAPFLLFPPLGLLLLFVFCVGPQMGVRYLLPVFPFLTVVASGALAPPVLRRTLVLSTALAGWSVLSSLSYHPFYMCYFNELIVHRLNAYRFLADSNLDWEDRAYFIAQFRRNHPDREISVDPPAPASGYVLVSANKLVGILDRHRYRWLRRNFAPIDSVGYSYLLFYVPREKLRVVLERGPASPSSDGE